MGPTRSLLTAFLARISPKELNATTPRPDLRRTSVCRSARTFGEKTRCCSRPTSAGREQQSTAYLKEAEPEPFGPVNVTVDTAPFTTPM